MIHTSFKKIRRKKRGENLLVDLWVIIAFVIVLIVVLLLFIATKKQVNQGIVQDFQSKDAAFMLDAYLRAPDLINGNTVTGKTIATIIAEDAANGNFTRTKGLTNYYFSGITTYSGTLENDYYTAKPISVIKVCIYDEKDSFLAGYEIDPQARTISDLHFYCGTVAQSSEYTYTLAKTNIPAFENNLFVELVIKQKINSK